MAVDEAMRRAKRSGPGQRLSVAWYPFRGRLTGAGADPHPCALMNHVMPAQVVVRPTGLASGSGWGRLSLAVSPLIVIVQRKRWRTRCCNRCAWCNNHYKKKKKKKKKEF